jgi:hypothetical protein
MSAHVLINWMLQETSQLPSEKVSLLDLQALPLLLSSVHKSKKMQKTRQLKLNLRLFTVLTFLNHTHLLISLLELCLHTGSLPLLWVPFEMPPKTWSSKYKEKFSTSRITKQAIQITKNALRFQQQYHSRRWLLQAFSLSFLHFLLVPFSANQQQAETLDGNIVSGIQIAFSASNSGGAWDNTKK